MKQSPKIDERANTLAERLSNCGAIGLLLGRSDVLRFLKKVLSNGCPGHHSPQRGETGRKIENEQKVRRKDRKKERERKKERWPPRFQPDSEQSKNPISIKSLEDNIRDIWERGGGRRGCLERCNTVWG